MKTYTYDDYYNATLELISKIFGEDVLNAMKNQKLKSFGWDGVDITSSDLLVTSPTIRTRFSESWMCDDDEMLNLFINSIFQYGYDQCANGKVKELKERIESHLDREVCASERDTRLRDKLKIEQELNEQLTNELEYYQRKFGKIK